MFSLDFLQEILFKIFAEQQQKKQQNQKIFRNKKKNTRSIVEKLLNVGSI